MQVPTRIDVVDGAQVELAWEDGSVQRLSAGELRAACPCASCRDPEGAGRARLLAGGPVPTTIDAATLVGDYAIGFVFGPDGHRTGIFSFDHLRSLAG